MNKYSLYIDVTAKVCVLSIIDKKSNVVDESITTTQNNLIELVNPKLQELLDRNNLGFKDISKIYVVYGPGSFTGVRVGVNIAKTIKSVYNDVEIYVINTLKLMTLGNGIATLDAKGKKWFIAAYRNHEPVLELQMVTEDKKNELLQEYNNFTYSTDLEIDEVHRAQHAYLYLDHFDLVEDWINLEPLYIKEAV